MGQAKVKPKTLADMNVPLEQNVFVRPVLKAGGHKVSIDCAENLIFYSHPGMHIVSKLVDQSMGGTISYPDFEDEGADFCIDVPASYKHQTVFRQVRTQI